MFNLFTSDEIDTSKSHQFDKDTFLDTLSCEQDMTEVIFINTQGLFNGSNGRSSEGLYTEGPNGFMRLFPTKLNELLLFNVTESVKELFGLVRCRADIEGDTNSSAVFLNSGGVEDAVAVSNKGGHLSGVIRLRDLRSLLLALLMLSSTGVGSDLGLTSVRPSGLDTLGREGRPSYLRLGFLYFLSGSV